MTGRTHDIAAFTTLTYIAATQPNIKMSLATLLVTISANLIGGLAPDIDQPTADLWHRLPAGSLVGKLLSPFLGGHRHISHSLIGIALFGLGTRLLLDHMSHVLLVDMNIVWWSFMIGYVSHLIMDTFTHEGVPWLFPIPIKFGIPPIKIFRIKTGGLREKLIIAPGLVILTAYIFFSHYAKFIDFLHHYVLH